MWAAVGFISGLSTGTNTTSTAPFLVREPASLSRATWSVLPAEQGMPTFTLLARPSAYMLLHAVQAVTWCKPPFRAGMNPQGISTMHVLQASVLHQVCSTWTPISGTEPHKDAHFEFFAPLQKHQWHTETQHPKPVAHLKQVAHSGTQWHI